MKLGPGLENQLLLSLLTLQHLFKVLSGCNVDGTLGMAVNEVRVCPMTHQQGAHLKPVNRNNNHLLIILIPISCLKALGRFGNYSKDIIYNSKPKTVLFDMVEHLF